MVEHAIGETSSSIDVPPAVMHLGRASKGTETVRWDTSHVVFGRDSESAYARATDTRIAVFARWDFDASKPPMPELIVPADVCFDLAESRLGKPVTIEHHPSGWLVRCSTKSGVATITGPRFAAKYPPLAEFERAARHAVEPPPLGQWIDPELLARVSVIFRSVARCFDATFGVQERLADCHLSSDADQRPRALLAEALDPTTEMIGLKLWAVIMPMNIKSTKLGRDRRGE